MGKHTIAGTITGSTLTATITGGGFSAYGIVANSGGTAVPAVINATVGGTNTTIWGKGASGSAGIYATLGASGAITSANGFHNISGTGYGIRLSGGGTNGSVTNNTINNSLIYSGALTGTGISFENGATPTFTGNTITGNLIGVAIDSSSCAIITSGNTITGNTTPISAAC